MSRILLLLAISLAASQAVAIEPPQSPKELRKNSDVIATVRVLAVLCLGERPFPHPGKKTPYYQAWLQVITATKGPQKPGETLIVEWQEVPQGLIGPWAVSYLPGEEVTTHLKWNESRRAYTTTWWNAKGAPSKPSTYKELSTKPGTLMLPK